MKMKELIKIQEIQNGIKAVSAREMYVSLGLNLANWKRWANKYIEKNPFAKENTDWVGFISLMNGLEARNTTSEVTEFSIHGYCGLHKIKVSYNEAQALGKLAAKKCRAQNAPIGKIRDFRFGIVNIYPEHILKQTFEEFLKQPRF
jgi:hypothetical protein